MNERCEEAEAGTSEVKMRKEKDRFVVGKGIVSAITGNRQYQEGGRSETL